MYCLPFVDLQLLPQTPVLVAPVETLLAMELPSIEGTFRPITKAQAQAKAKAKPKRKCWKQAYLSNKAFIDQMLHTISPSNAIVRSPEMYRRTRLISRAAKFVIS
jgi:hypothetical protein